MQYLSQFLIILGFSAVGELLSWLIPFPIPASVYGIVLLFAALQTGLLKFSRVETTGRWMQSILPILFVAPVVNLIDCWDAVAPVLLPIAVIMILSTAVIFGVAGLLTQALRRGKERKDA